MFEHVRDELVANFGFAPRRRAAHAKGVVPNGTFSSSPDRPRVQLGTMHLSDLVPDSSIAEQGLFFDPVRLVDGITLSDDPLLVGRTRTYPLSLARRHSGA